MTTRGQVLPLVVPPRKTDPPSLVRSADLGAPAQKLRERIASRSARIGIVGLGYVGVPTAVAYAEAGFAVVGIDIDQDRAAGVRAGRSHIEGVSDEAVGKLVRAGRLTALTSMPDPRTLDVIDICVHTPLDESREPDVSAIVDVAETLVAGLRPGQLVILTSTSYPGTTEEVLRPVLARSGLSIGDEVFLAFAPERIDPGNSEFTLRNTPKVIGGVTLTSTEVARQLYETIVDTVVPVKDATTAEMVKVLENTFRMVNIGFANEMAMICHRLGVDVWEVIDTATTKPYGFMAFYPGPGLGGHCIPVDPSYLAWKMRNLEYRTRFIDLGNDINRGMPDYVVRRAADVLNDTYKSVRGSRILIIGLAYKPNIADIRESPGVGIAARLLQRGGTVVYADPHVPEAHLIDHTPLQRAEITPEVLAAQDLVIVTTHHDLVDWSMVREFAPLVLDTRGVRGKRDLPNWHTL